MSSWDSYDTSGASALQQPSDLNIGQTLQGQSSAYSIMDFIGEGTFGKVAKCQMVDNKQCVAVKILKDKDTFKDTEREVSMLKEISILSPVHSHFVQFYEMFEYMGLYCLAFEMLDVDLYAFMENRGNIPLFLSEIRPIAQQLLGALNALKGLGVLHCDIKPDNVMFTNLQDQPLRVKLIDFGQAMRATEAEPGMMLQPYGYRAPEILLGLPFTESIDIWGVGCVLAYLYLADNLFPVNCEYQMMKCMVDLLGFPEDHLLQTGEYTKYFFTQDQSNEHAWRLLTPDEFTVISNMEAQEREGFFEFPSSLDGLVNVHPEIQAAKVEDKKIFVDLLKGLLHVDGGQRLTPHQALQHPFITMSHMKEHKFIGYLMVSEGLMEISPVVDSSVTDPVYVSNGESDIKSDDSKAAASIGADLGDWSLPETKDSDVWLVM